METRLPPWEPALKASKFCMLALYGWALNNLVIIVVEWIVTQIQDWWFLFAMPNLFIWIILVVLRKLLLYYYVVIFHAFAQMVGRVVYCWMKIYFVAWFGFLGTRRIDARWTAPVRLNGVLERFLLYISSSLSESPGDVVYNSTDIGFLTYRNDTLNAGTTYYVTLGVCVNVYLGYSCVVFIWIWIMLQISTISLIATTSAMRGLSTVYNKNCSFFLNSLIQMSVNRINFPASCFIRQIIVLHSTELLIFIYPGMYRWRMYTQFSS